MSIAQKKAQIFEYARRQTPQALDFTPIKADGGFQQLYAMHNTAGTLAITAYQRAGYTITPLGVDLRHLKNIVVIKNEVPDYMAERGEEIFCWDAKAKSHPGSFGIVNERAARSYRQFAVECNVPVYLNFVQVDKLTRGTSRETGHCNILDQPLRQGTREWNGNRIWKFNWQKGLAHLREEQFAIR